MGFRASSGVKYKQKRGGPGRELCSEVQALAGIFPGSHVTDITR